METDLGRVLDALPAMVWTALPDGRIDFVSRRWAEYTGSTLDQAHGWEWQAAINPDDLPKLLERWRSILTTGEPGEMEARLRRFDGQYRWFLVHSRPMRDDDGKIDKWCGVATDIEDSRQAEEALRRRNLDFQLIVDSIPVPVAVTTPTGEVEGLNQPTLDYFGKTFGELKGWKASDVVHPDDLERTVAAQMDAHQKGSAYNVESRHRRADGVYCWYNVRGFPLRDPQGRILRWFHLLTDIDDRKRAEEALRESEREARLIVNSIPAGIEILSPTGELEAVNSPIIRYFGKTEEELKRRGMTDFIHPDDLQNVLDTALHSTTTGEPYDAEQRFRGADGTYRWFQVRGLPLRDLSGRVVRWYGLHIDIDDRKRAEDALRASERNLAEIIDTIPALAWSAGPDGTAEFFNQHYLNYMGLSAEQAEGWGWTTAVHPDDVSGLAATWQAILASGKLGEAEARLLRKDGEYRWFLFRANPLRDEHGNVVKWYGVNTDIEDRKRAEEAVAASERNLSLITNTIPALAWSVHPDGSAEFFNRHYLDYVGISADQAQYWDFTVAIHPDDVTGLTATWQAIMASGEPGEAEARLRRFDGEYRWFLFRTNPLHDEAGNIIKWYGINTDIDERKRAEKALSASERYSRQIVDSIPGMVAVFTAGGELELVNHQVLEYYGRTFEELRSWATTDATHPEDLPRAIELFTQSIASGEPFEFEVRTRRFDGIYHWFQSRGFPLLDTNGRIVRWYNLLNDIDERKRAEEALSKARSELAHVARVSSLGALTASIAHEVNQPLSGIITNAGTCLRMLASDPPNVEGARETARRTIRDGNRAADVITRLRALFSKRATTIEPVDLNEAAREVIALSWGDLHRSRVVVRTELADELPPVGGNRVQLQQVIMNLLRNASDAMNGVDDRTRRMVIKTETDEHDHHVRLSVQDTGVGFGPDGSEGLFEAFYTTKPDGMGIGLSVSRSIIESHNGRLWAAANDGPGAIFTFSIPAHSGDEAPAHRAGDAHLVVTGIGQNAAEIS